MEPRSTPNRYWVSKAVALTSLERFGRSLGLLATVGLTGVVMNVFLAAELANLEHYLVGEFAEHSSVVDTSLVTRWRDWSAEVEFAFQKQLGRSSPGGLDLVGADDAHRNNYGPGA